MKLFSVVAFKPFVYFLTLAVSDSNERRDVAMTKFKEAFVSAETKEEAGQKIRSTLPPEDPKIKKILAENGGQEYYTIKVKELKGEEGVYYL